MELINGKYFIDGISALDLCKKYETPLYVYETAKMGGQYNKMLNAFKDARVKINYACKALSNINILKFFQEKGAGRRGRGRSRSASPARAARRR